VEPAALGSIEVTMRVTHTRVDIQIAADNPSTSALLVDTREALGQAVADAGMSLQSYEVALNVVSPSSGAAGAQGGAHSHEQQQTFSSERGFTNDDGAGQRQRPGAPQRDSRRRERASHDSLPVGLVL
jgi:flagellar hook-length control protein FliK